MGLVDLLQAFTGSDTLTLAILGGIGTVSGLAAWEFWLWCRLRHVPGPLSYALSIFPLARVCSSGKMSVLTKSLLDKYGMEKDLYFDSKILPMPIIDLDGIQVRWFEWALIRS